MGRKGVSKRKAKKMKTIPSENPTGTTSPRQEDSSPVQSLVTISTNAPAKTKGKSKKGK